MSSKRAFTLIELMVVLAIIAFLVGLLAMTVRDGIERGRAVSCRNNLRQIGIAIGKYKSDCGGWFMNRPPISTGFGKTAGIPVDGGQDHEIEAMGAKDGYSVRRHEDHLHGGVGDALGYEGEGGYSPDFIYNYVLAGNTNANDVAHCPKVDRKIFQTNSPYFKGCFVTNHVLGFEIYKEDVNGKLMSYAWSAHLASRPNDSVVAFIDWNAAQGWGASVDIGVTYTWRMRYDTIGSAVRNLYGTEGTSKGVPGYRTEIGYHHRSGTNCFANYVAVDGHVESILSNAPYADFKKIFTGK